jgi:Holliday junction resolvase RusA-like endonuclease
MTIVSVFAVPASWSRKRQAQALAGTIAKTTKPDIENSVKGAMDALQSVAYCDDRQIVSLIARKVYGDRPRLEIELRPL